jgi:hypothetical protein
VFSLKFEESISGVTHSNSGIYWLCGRVVKATFEMGDASDGFVANIESSEIESSMFEVETGEAA